jgi:branched-chain amino acid transport system permease protein
MTASEGGSGRSLLLGCLAILAVAGLAAAMPFLGVSSYARTLVYYAAYFLALGQAWNLMSGLTGYVSFAHGALAGIGAYAGVIALNAEMPLALSLLVAAAATAIFSLAIGATSLRLRGTAFTFATLFMQETVLLLVRKLPFAGGPGGIVLEEIMPLWLPHVLMLAVAGGATTAVLIFRRTRTGLRVQALRDDEGAAGAVGIPATRLKLALFCASAAVAGVTGAVHGIFASSLFPNVVFAVDLSIIALAVPLIGGSGTAFGPVVGAVLYVALREVLQVVAPNLHLAIVGFVLLGIVLFLREGIVPALARILTSRPRREPPGRPVPEAGA